MTHPFLQRNQDSNYVIVWDPGADPNGTELFITNLMTAWGKERARAYFERLAGQQVVNFGSGSARTLVDRVIAGEYPTAMNIFAHHPVISAAQGAPVQSKLLDPVPSTASTVVIPTGVNHPYSSMLLIDFMLSQEGRQILADAEYFPVREDTPPLEHLRSVIPQTAGIESNFIAPDVNATEEADAIFQEYFR